MGPYRFDAEKISTIPPVEGGRSLRHRLIDLVLDTAIVGVAIGEGVVKVAKVTGEVVLGTIEIVRNPGSLSEGLGLPYPGQDPHRRQDS